MKIYHAIKPDFEYIDKKRTRARLKSDFYFVTNHVYYVIKAGFEWDGASIPWILRWKYGTPFDKVHLVGGLVHDAIYGNVAIAVHYDKHDNAYFSDLADFTRFQADSIYYALIREYGAVMFRAFKEWAAVRFCGRSHWTKR